MKNTFKLIPATLALLFGGVVQAQPTTTAQPTTAQLATTQPETAQPATAQSTVACTIEKGRFDPFVYITFKGQGEGEESIRFCIPVKIEDKKYFVRLLDNRITELSLEAQLKEEMVALSNSITDDIIERLLNQTYIETPFVFCTFANFKKRLSYLFEGEGYIKYLENRHRAEYLQRSFKVEISDKQISNDLYQKLEKLDTICREHFHIALFKVAPRSLLSKKMSTSEKACIVAVFIGTGLLVGLNALR